MRTARSRRNTCRTSVHHALRSLETATGSPANAEMSTAGAQEVVGADDAGIAGGGMAVGDTLKADGIARSRSYTLLIARHEGSYLVEADIAPEGEMRAGLRRRGRYLSSG